jgi:hypothetical protein
MRLIVTTAMIVANMSQYMGYLHTEALHLPGRYSLKIVALAK